MNQPEAFFIDAVNRSNYIRMISIIGTESPNESRA